MAQKLEMSTATVAGGAASSPVWLPSAEQQVSMLSNPLWAELLAPLGVFWLVIQIAFYLYDRYKKYKAEEEASDE